MKTKPKTLFVSLIVLLLFLSGCVKNNQGVEPATEISAEFSACKGVYWITEALDDETLDLYLDGGKELFDGLLEFRNRLNSASSFDYYAYCNNLVEIIETEVPDACLVNYGTEYADESRYLIDGKNISAADAIQVSANWFDLFPLKIADGRGFSETDFNYTKTMEIPVILGSEYSSSFSIGDVFTCWYICEDAKLKVIGFAEPGSCFYAKSENRMLKYDRYIIMPFAEITEDSYLARRVLLQQINGFAGVHNERKPAADEFTECLSGCLPEDWREQIIFGENDIFEKMNPNPAP